MNRKFDNTAWPIAVQPKTNELLSSFLVRVAHAHGLAPTRFCYYHFPNDSVWNRDIDQNANLNFIKRVSTKAALPLERVKAMTLTGLPALSLNRLGIYHRVRNRHGLRFCPQCLANCAVYLRDWRSVCAVYCPLHRCSLLDACTSCGAMVIPHRTGKIDHCFSCGSSLALQPSEQVMITQSQLVEFQQTCIDSFTSNVLESPSDLQVSYLAALEILQRLRKARIDSVISSSDPLPSFLVASFAEPIPSLSRTAGAIFHLESTNYLFKKWPESFRQIARILNLHSRSLGELNPNWSSQIIDEIQRLPQRSKREPSSPRSTVRNKLRKIHRQRLPDWRVKRAILLLKEAKVHHVY